MNSNKLNNKMILDRVIESSGGKTSSDRCNDAADCPFAEECEYANMHVHLDDAHKIKSNKDHIFVFDKKEALESDVSESILNELSELGDIVVVLNHKIMDIYAKATELTEKYAFSKRASV